MYPKKTPTTQSPASLGKKSSTRSGDHGPDAKFSAANIIMISEIDDIPMDKEVLVGLIDTEPMALFEIVERMERAIDLLRGAAILANVGRYPTNCPRCGENLIPHMLHDHAETTEPSEY